MLEKNKALFSTKTLILIALFAALTFVGTNLRIPLPAPVGAPFIHLGNAVVAFATLFLGFRGGLLAGGLGFLIFDLLNGYFIEAPFIFVETILVTATYAFFFQVVFREGNSPFLRVSVPIILGVLVKIVCSFLEDVFFVLIAGGTFPVAVTGAFSSILATVINGVGTILIVSLFYSPLKKVFQQVLN